MKLIIFVTFISVSLLDKTAVNSQQPTTDFCAAGLCPAGIVQTGCNNPGILSLTCPVGAEVIPLTTEMKQAIVIRHNMHRNEIASGSMMPKFPAAIRMATIRWNAELATLALDNAITCVFAHDMCRATTQFPFSGQNIAKNWWSNGFPADLINSVFIPQIDAFWAENVDATLADINSYPASPPKVIGHFTVMVAEKNTAVGCGAIKYNDPTNQNRATIVLMCNYAWTNIINYGMYRPGTNASLCSTGVNANFPSLCAISEPYNLKAP